MSPSAGGCAADGALKQSADTVEGVWKSAARAVLRGGADRLSGLHITNMEQITGPHIYRLSQNVEITAVMKPEQTELWETFLSLTLLMFYSMRQR